MSADDIESAQRLYMARFQRIGRNHKSIFAKGDATLVDCFLVPRESDGLNVGEIELLPEEQELPLPEEYRPMAAILSGVLDDLGRLYEDMDRRLDDAGWVTNRFVEILPIDIEDKQLCLEQSDPAARLRLVQSVLKHVRSPA
jgi:Lon protease-like protein